MHRGAYILLPLLPNTNIRHINGKTGRLNKARITIVESEEIIELKYWYFCTPCLYDGEKVCFAILCFSSHISFPIS